MHFLLKTHYFVRSLLFNIFYIIFSIVYCTLFLLTVFLPLKVRLYFSRFWNYTMLYAARIILGIRYEVIGREHLSKKASIVLCKHQSAWETILMPCLFKNSSIILKREILFIPFFGWALALTRPIAIQRKRRRAAMNKIIIEGKKYFANGRWIVFFPEGTRTVYGVKDPYYHSGGARLAIATEQSITPVALNSGKYWPRKSFLKTPGTIKVIIGPAISSKGKTDEELTEGVKRWIEGHVA
jgi:1-acyl-sn-glycerol-3-phosphate acyltransferase